VEGRIPERLWSARSTVPREIRSASAISCTPTRPGGGCDAGFWLFSTDNHSARQCQVKLKHGLRDIKVRVRGGRGREDGTETRSAGVRPALRSRAQTYGRRAAVAEASPPARREPPRAAECPRHGSTSLTPLSLSKRRGETSCDPRGYGRRAVRATSMAASVLTFCVAPHNRDSA
jgi:hypothetical protein